MPLYVVLFNLKKKVFFCFQIIYLLVLILLLRNSIFICILVIVYFFSGFYTVSDCFQYDGYSSV